MTSEPATSQAVDVPASAPGLRPPTPGAPAPRPPDREREPGRDIDLASLLSALYQPILPWLKRLTLPRDGIRAVDPRHILLPDGYQADVIARGFNAPVMSCFDDAGGCYVIESGHKVEEQGLPRIVRVDLVSGDTTTIYQWPKEQWKQTGAVTGACWYQGALYVMDTDTLYRFRDGVMEPIVTGLPGRGDHQANHPVVGPDGKIYFGVGSATNMGVVGADNYGYGWLPHYPNEHDVPGADVLLTGRNYAFRNVLGSVTEQVETGAFVPFGTRTSRGQVVAGSVKASGSVLRCDPDGANLELVCWGLRNPYGLAFAPDGTLYATEHGSDERGGRYIVGDPDDLYRIEQGAWYGWPDYASGLRLDDPVWGRGGQGREPVIADPPTTEPPVPVASFQPHVGANGIAIAPEGRFGFAGQAFVALFGDVAPLTAVRQLSPVGYAVVRVDLAARKIHPFAVNRIAGPASKLFHNGFERPSHVAFGPDGALYVTDFGEIKIAVEKGGLRMQHRTGVLWRIRRVDGRAGEEPPKPLAVPLYGLAALGTVAAVVGLVVGVVAGLAGRARRRRNVKVHVPVLDRDVGLPIRKR